MRTAVVMTALPAEYLAVRAFLTDVVELIHPAGTVYERGTFRDSVKPWTVIVAETGAGNTIAAIETSRALDMFRPSVVMFVGVAGGLRDVRLGDVVAADYIYTYEPSKMTTSMESRVKTLGCGYPLVQRARAVRRDDRWQRRIKQGMASPRGFIGPIASGEQVLAGANTPTHAFIEQYCGDALAVEMEGWGFVFAAHSNDDVPSIVIRGVSDMTGDDKDSDRDLRMQPMAAAHAAAFAFELLADLDRPRASRTTSLSKRPSSLPTWSPLIRRLTPRVPRQRGRRARRFV
jgi:nucleoside phosphorylase